MTPETWSGLAAIAAGLAAGVTGSWRVAGVVAEKLRVRIGNGVGHAAPSNGGITAALARIEHEVSDRTGSVRTVKHDLAQLSAATAVSTAAVAEEREPMKRLFGEILGAPNALFGSIVRGVLVDRLKDGAEGRYGPLAQKGLLAVKGSKTVTGLLLGMVAFVASQMGSPVASWCGTIAAILLAAGLADKGLHAPGRPEVLADSAWYRLLADHAGLIATALTAAFAYVNGATCIELMVRSLSLSCAGQSKALLV